MCSDCCARAGGDDEACGGGTDAATATRSTRDPIMPAMEAPPEMKVARNAEPELVLLHVVQDFACRRCFLACRSDCDDFFQVGFRFFGGAVVQIHLSQVVMGERLVWIDLQQLQEPVFLSY